MLQAASTGNHLLATQYAAHIKKDTKMDNLDIPEETYTPEETIPADDSTLEKETVANMNRIDFLTMLEELEFR